MTQTEQQAFNSLDPEQRENPVYVHAFASPGLLEAETSGPIPDLWLGPFCGLQVTYQALRSLNTGDAFLIQGSGLHEDCWFTHDGRGPFSDFVITHQVPDWLDDFPPEKPPTPTRIHPLTQPLDIAVATKLVSAEITRLGGRTNVLIPGTVTDAGEYHGTVAWRRTHDDVAVTHHYVVAGETGETMLIWGDYATREMNDEELVARACARSQETAPPIRT